MTTAGRRPLLGRQQECKTLDQLVSDVKSGRSRVLVLRGEAGIGKTALLNTLVHGAAGCRIVQAAGHESEMEMAFSGLHQLCAAFLDRLASLPAPQRDALGTAFGLSIGPPPDRYLVGLAVLSLLADVADEQPVIWVVDDVSWLDRASAQILAFVARRLLAERVGLVFAVRDSEDPDELADLPDLVVRGLREPDARALLESVLGGPTDDGVRDRIVEETRGNPLALLELPRDMSPAQLAGGFRIPGTGPLTKRLEQAFLARFDVLPHETRRLLLIAAAEPLGDVALLWRAADQLGIPVTAAASAESSGLVQVGSRVRFRHPLVRSAIYHAAEEVDRQDAHRALGASADAEHDPDRKAWHQAHATAQPDEAVAAALELSAGRARARGGLAAAAAFLSRAVALTPDPSVRVFRALAAVEAALLSGAPEDALSLLAIAEAQPLDEFQGALAELLRAAVTFTMYRGTDGPGMLLKAARRMEPFNVELARDTYLDAFSAAIYADGAEGSTGMREVARVAQNAPRPEGKPRKGDLLLDCRTSLALHGYAATVPLAKRTVEAFVTEPLSTEEALRWLWLAEITAVELGDDESGHRLTRRHVETARSVGALYELSQALLGVIFAELYAGDLRSAASFVEEARVLRELTGANHAPRGALGLAAFQGRESVALDVRDAVLDIVIPRGEGSGLVLIDWAFGLMYNGLGRHEEALLAARAAAKRSPEVFLGKWALPELVEAAVRCGRREEAEAVVEELAMMAGAARTDWLLGNEARARALVCTDGSAQAYYEKAIAHFGRIRSRTELARGHLVYGEWLRGHGQKAEARTQLRTAHGMFAEMGLEGFADRARRELLATGETVRSLTVSASDELTAQEAQIARLAADGRTNPEIGAELFISPRTVEWHLRKVYPKLGVASRRELRAVMSGGR